MDINKHNLFQNSLDNFLVHDPHLANLAKLKHQYHNNWWQEISLAIAGIYILTGGRQIGKSTSCKQLLANTLKNKQLNAEQCYYLTCDEIYDAKQFSEVLRSFLNIQTSEYLIIIDEVTFVPNWDRVIKALADEGYFTKGVVILTGSDSLILKEAAMSFPGRRGIATKIDFHIYPLTFRQYVDLVNQNTPIDEALLNKSFANYLVCGGYLRAINDLAEHGTILTATTQTYKQWIRGDFLKHGRNESYLLELIAALIDTGASQISYSRLTEKIGRLSKETCIQYCNLLERMDVLFNLQAIDLNKKQGFPKKARKFHFFDPFIYQVLLHWLQEENHIANITPNESILVEACVASHLYRKAKTFYFKGQGEIDIIWQESLRHELQALEVKWSNQLRSSDLKSLRNFSNSKILTKQQQGVIDDIKAMPVMKFLYDLD